MKRKSATATPTTEKSPLETLVDRLKSAQHALLDDAANQQNLPSEGALRRICLLETAITAACELIKERARPATT